MALWRAAAKRKALQDAADIERHRIRICRKSNNLRQHIAGACLR
jgi:hypothetical protein